MVSLFAFTNFWQCTSSNNVALPHKKNIVIIVLFSFRLYNFQYNWQRFNHTQKDQYILLNNINDICNFVGRKLSIADLTNKRIKLNWKNIFDAYKIERIEINQNSANLWVVSGSPGESMVVAYKILPRNTGVAWFNLNGIRWREQRRLDPAVAVWAEASGRQGHGTAATNFT